LCYPTHAAKARHEWANQFLRTKKADRFVGPFFNPESLTSSYWFLYAFVYPLTNDSLNCVWNISLSMPFGILA